MLFAKYPEAAEGLSKQFRSREVRYRYIHCVYTIPTIAFICCVSLCPQTVKYYLAEVSGHVGASSVARLISGLSPDELEAKPVVMLSQPGKCASGHSISTLLSSIRINAPLAPMETGRLRQVCSAALAGAVLVILIVRVIVAEGRSHRHSSTM